MNKVLLLSFLLPISFLSSSVQAVSPAFITKLGGAAVAGAISVYSAVMAKEAYGDGKSPMRALDAAPWIIASISSGILAGLALGSAFDFDFQAPIKNIRIK